MRFVKNGSPIRSRQIPCFSASCFVTSPLKLFLLLWNKFTPYCCYFFPCSESLKLQFSVNSLLFKWTCFVSLFPQFVYLPTFFQLLLAALFNLFDAILKQLLVWLILPFFILEFVIVSFSTFFSYFPQVLFFVSPPAFLFDSSSAELELLSNCCTSNEILLLFYLLPISNVSFQLHCSSWSLQLLLSF